MRAIAPLIQQALFEDSLLLTRVNVIKITIIINTDHKLWIMKSLSQGAKSLIMEVVAIPNSAINHVPRS